MKRDSVETRIRIFIKVHKGRHPHPEDGLLQNCVFEFTGGHSVRHFALQKEIDTKWHLEKKRLSGIQATFYVLKTCVGLPSSYPAALQGKENCSVGKFARSRYRLLEFGGPGRYGSDAKIHR